MECYLIETVDTTGDPQASKQFGRPKSRQNGFPLPAIELSLNELLHFVMLMFYVSLKNKKKHKIQKNCFFFDKKHV